MSRAGIRAAGAEPGRRSPSEVSLGDQTNQWSCWEASDIDGTEGRAHGQCASQSNQYNEPDLSSATLWRVVVCPRREWNPRERRDMDEAPQEVSSRERTNQSNGSVELVQVLQPWRVVVCPRWEWSPRERCDIDQARRASFREKASQSNRRFALPSSWPTLWCDELCPRRESNPHLRFRKPLFFPLNYGDCVISDFRSRIADFK